MPRENAAALAENVLSIRPPADEFRESDGLVERWALFALDGFGIALDLREDGVAEPEALVAELVHELRLVFPAGGVHRTHRFEQAERQERVDGGGHVRAEGDRAGASKVSAHRPGVQLTWGFRDSRPRPASIFSPFPRPERQIEEGLVIRALVGAAVAAGITAAARKTRTLSESGQWAAFLFGIVTTAAGWWWAGLLIAFFVSSAALTRWRAPEKVQRTEGTLPHGLERNATQVLVNGGLFVLFVLAARYAESERWAYAALGALAAASSDTWSTEIGTLFGAKPRLITTWKEVEPGMSGGVSIEGFGAGIAGALFIALPGAFAIPDHHLRLAVAAALGGFGGCIADSLIGATLQSRRFCDRCRNWTERRTHTCGYRTRHARGIYWVTNDIVNLAGTFAGAVIAVLSSTLMH